MVVVEQKMINFNIWTVLVIQTAPQKNSHKLVLLSHQRSLLRMLVLVGQETRILYQQVQWRHQTRSIQNLDQQVFSTKCQRTRVPIQPPLQGKDSCTFVRD